MQTVSLERVKKRERGVKWQRIKVFYLDTNVILRYLLEDCEKFIEQAKFYLEEQEVYIRNEVLAEVVYVLHKTYKVPKETLKTTLLTLIQNKNIHVESFEVIQLSLEIFEKNNIDFVDALLCSYHKILHHQVTSFDKKLNKCIEQA